MSTKLKVTIGGAAVVCCVHDRPKREVVDVSDVIQLGRTIGVEYDERIHKLHECACCENLFVAFDDTPRFCTPCQSPLVHSLGGELPRPIGVVI